MFRQARELFSLPGGGDKKAAVEMGDKEKKTKEKKKAKKATSKNSAREKNGKLEKRAKVDKLAANSSKVSEQFENYDKSALELARSAGPELTTSLEEHLRQRSHNSRVQNHSSSSGGSSSGYLSQTNGFQSIAATLGQRATTNHANEEPLQGVTFTPQNGAVGEPDGCLNGLHELEQQQQQQQQQRRHQSLRPTLLKNLPVVADARSLGHPQHLNYYHNHNHNHRQQHFQTPSMLPMMIDDDDEQLDSEHGDHNDDDDDDDDDLDVRQMLASHRNRRLANEADQLDQQHYAGLIDGFQATSAQTRADDDKLSQPTYGQPTRRSLALTQGRPRVMPLIPRPAASQQPVGGYHANSADDDSDENQRQRYEFNGATFRSDAHVASFARSGQRHQYQEAANQHHQSSSANQGETRAPFENRLVSTASQQLLSRYAFDSRQEQASTAAIYYQPNLIHNQLSTQHQRHQNSHERARNLHQSTSSFLYLGPNSPHLFAVSRRHQQQQQQFFAASKPAPPLPPAPSSISRKLASSSALANANLNHTHDNHRAGTRMMQASSSRQHLSSATVNEQHEPLHQHQHQHHHQHHNQHHSSPSPVSTHSRRNHASLKINSGGAQVAGSQLGNAKQNLRTVVPNRSTTTPTHMAQNGSPLRPPSEAGGQVLPSAVLAADEPATSMSCCGKMAKFLSFVANALLWSAGIALGAWGILALVEDHKYNVSQLLVFEPTSRLSLFQLLSWSFITLGCATILVGFCGCSAMFKNSRWILGLYIFLILAIFALDLATGLLAIIFQERLVANVRLKLVNKLRNEYGIQASFTAAIDYIQTRYECCGLDGHFDYDQSLWRLQRLGGFEATVARTCCHLRNTFDDQAHVNPRPVNESMCQSADVRFHQSYRYRRGCLDDLERLIRHKIWIFTIGCGAVGAIILLCLVFATCFCRSIPSARGSRKSSAATATGNRVYGHQQKQAVYLETTTSAKKSRHSNYRPSGLTQRGFENCHNGQASQRESSSMT